MNFILYNIPSGRLVDRYGIIRQIKKNLPINWHNYYSIESNFIAPPTVIQFGRFFSHLQIPLILYIKGSRIRPLSPLSNLIWTAARSYQTQAEGDGRNTVER